MSETEIAHYLVTKPLFEIGKNGAGLIKGRQLPTMTYMSNALVPNCNTYVEYGWIWEMPDPNPHIREHSHEFNEVVLHFDPSNPQDLGAELEIFIEGEGFSFDTNMAAFMPAGVKHTPIVWKRVTRPHIEMSVTLGNGNYGYRRKDPSLAQATPPPALWQKPEGFAFESLIVKKPEAGAAKIGRQTPPMTYMSNALVPGSNTHVELSWISEVPEPNPNDHGHVHDFDEMMLYIGSDPSNPEDLGAEVGFVVDGQMLEFATNAALFLPAGIQHSPVTWKSVTRPLIQISFALGNGDGGMLRV